MLVLVLTSANWCGCPGWGQCWYAGWGWPLHGGCKYPESSPECFMSPSPPPSSLHIRCRHYPHCRLSSWWPVTTATGCSVITWRQIKCQFKATSIVRCAALCWQPVVARLGAGRVCDVFGIKLGFCWLVVCSLNVRQSRYFDKVGRTGQCGHGHVGTEQGMGGMEGILALRRLIDQTYCFITIAMAVLCKNVWRLRWSVWK